MIDQVPLSYYLFAERNFIFYRGGWRTDSTQCDYRPDVCRDDDERRQPNLCGLLPLSRFNHRPGICLYDYGCGSGGSGCGFWLFWSS